MYVGMCMHACAYVHVVCMHVYQRVYMYTCTCKCLHVCARPLVYIYVYVYAQICNHKPDEIRHFFRST